MKAQVKLASMRICVVCPLLVVAVLLFLPSAGMTRNMVSLLFATFVWTITSVAWNLLGGFTGQTSFGFAVFYGLGAYTTGLMINAGRSPYFSFIAGAGVAVPPSFLVGLPPFLLRVPSFAVTTIRLTAPLPGVMR